MADNKFLQNPNYLESVRLIKEDYLAKVAGDDSFAARAAAQDDLMAYWSELDEDEKARLWGLSSDLQMIEGKEKFRAATLEERSKERLGPQLAEAMKRQDWQRWLELLRFGPTFLTAYDVALQRGQCWQNLGHDDIALLFYDFAIEQNPTSEIAHILTLQTLLKLGRTAEAQARVDEYTADAVSSYQQTLSLAE